MTDMNFDRAFFKLDDSVIIQIVRVLQLGILTGTDISDHIRMFVLEASSTESGALVLTPEYLEKDAKDIQRMLDEIAALEQQVSKDSN